MCESKIFLLSPAHCGGKRASFIFSESAQFPLARRLRDSDGAPLGEIFSFLSGLYFRGKLAYSQAFAAPPPGLAGAYVITSNRGLLPVHTPINLAQLRAFGDVDIQNGGARYRRPLERDVRHLLDHPDCTVVLLGSIATGKYTDVLLRILGDRLHFPREFVGRGDMSRGGLMLRCARQRQELTYIPVRGATLNGKRPARLAPVNRVHRRGEWDLRGPVGKEVW